MLTAHCVNTHCLTPNHPVVAAMPEIQVHRTPRQPIHCNVPTNLVRPSPEHRRVHQKSNDAKLESSDTSCSGTICNRTQPTPSNDVIVMKQLVKSMSSFRDITTKKWTRALNTQYPTFNNGDAASITPIRAHTACL